MLETEKGEKVYRENSVSGDRNFSVRSQRPLFCRIGAVFSSIGLSSRYFYKIGLPGGEKPKIRAVET
ncbi:hypothetical protein, partial [Metabacillus mangrovi]|uniref:hypothetical protein n=1 Tax=Metabacillus mangrovi TaxID=1491830 RepID=UPI0019D55A7D